MYVDVKFLKQFKINHIICTIILASLEIKYHISLFFYYIQNNIFQFFQNLRKFYHKVMNTATITGEAKASKLAKCQLGFKNRLV